MEEKVREEAESTLVMVKKRLRHTPKKTVSPRGKPMGQRQMERRRPLVQDKPTLSKSPVEKPENTDKTALNKTTVDKSVPKKHPDDAVFCKLYLDSARISQK